MIIQKLASGLTVRTYPVAPATFDIGRASADDRAAYGFPRLSSAATCLRDRWEARAGQYKFVEPSFRLRGRRRLGLPKLRTHQGQQTSAIWSGALAKSQGKRLQWVEGAWTMPAAELPQGAVEGDHVCASAWIGLDGDDGSNDVLQAGCDVDVSLIAGVIQRRYRPWWEWYPGGSFWLDNLVVSPGDVLDCLIHLQPGSRTAATVFFANRTTNIAMTFSASAPDGTALAGNCAEWVVEAFDNVGPLAQFGAVDFSDCNAGAANGVAVPAGVAGSIDMTGPDGRVLVSSAIVGQTGVRVTHV